MTWFVIDDGFHSHPKARRAGKAACGVWVMAGSWSCATLTDGFIPAWFVDSLDARAEAASLVRVRLWHRHTVDGERGYRFHQWDEYQRDARTVKAQRRSNAARQKLTRDKPTKQLIRDRDGDNCRYCAVEVKWTDRRGDLGGTYDHRDPEGPSDETNLVVCCRGCNARKGHRTEAQAEMFCLPPGTTEEDLRADLDAYLSTDLPRAQLRSRYAGLDDLRPRDGSGRARSGQVRSEQIGTGRPGPDPAPGDGHPRDPYADVPPDDTEPEPDEHDQELADAR